jgi:uncharacterized protein (DUF58 family)
MRGLLSRLRRRARSRRRLTITREGGYFLTITVLIGVAAVNTGNNLLYLILGWMLSAIMASGVMSDLSLRRLRVQRRPPPQVFANRPFLMEIAVENRKRFMASYSIEIEDLVDGKPLDKRCYFLKIPPGRVQRTAYRHTFHRRGRVQFTGFRMGSRYPFTLFRKSRDMPPDAELIVLPAVYPMRPPNPHARDLGETSTPQIGRQGEFFGLREFRSGDGKHDIHWRSSARTGALMVREYERERQRRAIIVVENGLNDDADDGARDALERAISMAASLANAYTLAGYQISLAARGTWIPFAAGPSQLAKVLRALALLPTVAPSAPFSGRIAPGVDSILVVAKGAAPSDLPPGISRVLEAA